MALKKKSKKKLKKLIARARMKRVQLIMAAIKIHQKSRNKSLETDKQTADNVSQSLTRKIIGKKIKALRGKISASRKRSRDLWTKR